MACWIGLAYLKLYFLCLYWIHAANYCDSPFRWSAEFGGLRNGSPELHNLIAEYIYSESPELDMARVSAYFVRGDDPKKFASALVNFMGKCYPSEDDVAIARAILLQWKD
ncbi:golgi-to-ER traffic-like protein [Thalictrum thalictroides]|uniref:Golgi-to-ER traffic-like protein n=1 Tax=Thalictrum thalictroides TaxID=46969 RepID=A0A7J6VNF6_THATH|nr:golgi-to-ER traffic-like protein [Thalictrum thalictroides]